jgi:hypothetical protein
MGVSLSTAARIAARHHLYPGFVVQVKHLRTKNRDPAREWPDRISMDNPKVG